MILLGVLLILGWQTQAAAGNLSLGRSAGKYFSGASIQATVGVVVDDLDRARTQKPLWYNFGTTFRQLWDNIGTILTQLRDNFETTWITWKEPGPISVESARSRAFSRHTERCLQENSQCLHQTQRVLQSHTKTRSSWLNCALRYDEAVYWVSIGHSEAVAVGNWWYWVSRGHLCLYILHKVEIWTGVTDAWLTDWQTDNLER